MKKITRKYDSFHHKKQEPNSKMGAKQGHSSWYVNLKLISEMIPFYLKSNPSIKRPGSTFAQVMVCCQAITRTNVDWSSVKSSDIRIRAISQEMPIPSSTKICLKITYLKISFKFPRANKLIQNSIVFVQGNALGVCNTTTMLLIKRP